MSLWGNMMDRSSGIVPRKEDFAAIYGCDSGCVQTGEYKDFQWKVMTNGNFPTIEIQCNEDQVLNKNFNTWIIKLDDSKIFFILHENHIHKSKFYYEFNKEGDYQYDINKEGKIYDVEELIEFSKKIIDKIIERNNNILCNNLQ